jgi:hypothetical protein
MPVGILKFKLPEEQEEFTRASDADIMSSYIWHFRDHLRSEIKHGDLGDVERDIYEQIYKDYHEQFEKYLQ